MTQLLINEALEAGKGFKIKAMAKLLDNGEFQGRHAIIKSL
jgi:hypothetical protein